MPIRRKSPNIRNQDADLDSYLDEEYQSITGTVAFIENEEYEGDSERSYCPSCYQKVNVIQYLGPVILQKDEEVPRDYDNWKQCYKCGRKYAKSEVKRESKISDIVDVYEVDPNSEDEIETPIALRHDTNNSKHKGRLQRFREKQNLSRPGRKIKDPDAIAAIKKGLEVTNYEEHQIGQE